jgi:hypothetical protein
MAGGRFNLRLLVKERLVEGCLVDGRLVEGRLVDDCFVERFFQVYRSESFMGYTRTLKVEVRRIETAFS